MVFGNSNYYFFNELIKLGFRKIWGKSLNLNFINSILNLNRF